MRALTAPEGGTPPLVDSPEMLRAAVAQLQGGSGPIAIDAERASGFRYSARAYLIQIFRRGGGLHLIDPIPLRGLDEVQLLDSLIGDQEVIIHASTQDLPCLREFGIHPRHLFDTELAARIAGLERVGLAPLCESLLEIALAKEHSAVDWSTRPLLQEWLDYAALDVEVLIDLRDKVEALLLESGKLEYAKQDFAAILTAPQAKPKSDPWRKTSGMHLIKARYELAIIRQLWMARDQIAQELDIAPGRLFSDSIMVDVARYKPQTKSDFLNLNSVKARIKNDRLRDLIDIWWGEIQRCYDIPESEWPEMRGRGDGPPPPRIWKERFKLAYAHLTHARAALLEISLTSKIPVENLMTPELVRRIIFDQGRERRFHFSDQLVNDVAAQLADGGARPWQIELCAGKLARSLTFDKPLPPPPPETTSETPPESVHNHGEEPSEK